MTTTSEERAEGLFDDYNRARAAILRLRASFEEAAALPIEERGAVGGLLDPVGRLLLDRDPDGPERRLVYVDFGELIAQANLCRSAAGVVLGRISALGDMHSDGTV